MFTHLEYSIQVFFWLLKDPSKYAAIVAKRYVRQCLVPSGTFPLSRALAFTVHSHRYYLLQVSAQGHNYGHLLDMGKFAKEDTTPDCLSAHWWFLSHGKKISLPPSQRQLLANVDSEVLSEKTRTHTDTLTHRGLLCFFWQALIQEDSLIKTGLCSI